MDRQRLRAAVIGVGRRGRSHAGSILAMHDRYELAAVCDASEAAAQSAARELKVPGYADLERMLAEQSLDVIVIATPPETHHVAASAAARHGVHMLIESPLATTRRMMDLIRDGAAKASVHVEVAENKYRWPDARLNRQALDAGAIGTVLRVGSFYEDAGHESCYHTISKLQYYAGADVVEVEAHTATAALASRALLPDALKGQSTPGASVKEERWTQALLRFANGVSGSCVFVSSWLTPGRRGHPHFTTIEGDAGFIAITGTDRSGLHWTHDGQRRDAEMKIDYADESERKIPIRFYYECNPVIEYRNPFPSYAIEAQPWGMGDAIARFAQLDSIHRAVTTGSLPEYGIGRAIRDQMVSIAIIEAASQRRPLRLDQLNSETAWERQQHEMFRRAWGRDAFVDV